MRLLQRSRPPTTPSPLEIEDLGYNLAIVGQKTYNGVAILSSIRSPGALGLPMAAATRKRATSRA